MAEVRSCRPDELAEVLDLVNLVFRTSQGRPATIGDDYPHIYAAANLDNIITVHESGGIRACVSTLPMRVACGDLTFETLGVNCTTTHPDWRRRGFGEQMMKEIARRATAQGCDLVHLDAGVPEWYRDLGYEYGGRINYYIVHRGNADLLPTLSQDGEVMRGNEPATVAAAHALHESERLGTVRALEDSAVAYARSQGELVAAARDGVVVAYAYVRRTDATVIEHGGRAVEVAGLLKLLFEELDNASKDEPRTGRADNHRPQRRPLLRVEVSPLASLDPLLAGRLYPARHAYWHMFYLANVEQTVAKLDAPLAVAGDGTGHFELRRDADASRYSRGQLVQLLFGPEARGAVAGGVVPIGAPVHLSTPYTDHV